MGIRENSYDSFIIGLLGYYTSLYFLLQNKQLSKLWIQLNLIIIILTRSAFKQYTLNFWGFMRPSDRFWVVKV